MATGEQRPSTAIDPAKDRPNKATVTDADLTAAFQQGFDEAQRVISMVWTYHVDFFFEAQKLRTVQYGDPQHALSEIGQHLANGPGTRVEIEVTGEPLQADAPSVPNDDEVVDAEIVSGE